MNTPARPTGSLLVHLECPRCGKTVTAEQLATHCDCPGPWFPRYELDPSAGRRILEKAGRRPSNLWRFAEVLPVRSWDNVTSLGEGDTPTLRVDRLGARYGLGRLWIKDESQNPTGSFKARGLSAAVSRAKELGAVRLAAPSAGNAGLAMAAYAARAGLSTHVAFPSDVPKPFIHHSRALGADVHLVDGTISDAGKRLEEALRREGLAEEVFRLSTLKEPYRLEGKKTMGYELVPPWGPGLPDVIVYPTGGGTGLVGMWKAFAEMEALGWIGKERPRMVSVQLDTCAPIVEAWRRGLDAMPADLPPTVPTAACGLRVPHPFADREILQTLRESDGFAVSVNEEEILAAQAELSELEGVLAAPESAATVAAIPYLIDTGVLAPDTMTVLFITGGSALYT